MLRGITVIVGPARCGKTDRLVEAFRRALVRVPLGAALWLSPTHRSAAAVGRQILSGSLAGCFNPHCLTFDQFARRVIDASSRKTRPIGPTLQRQILRRLIGEAMERGQLRYFAPIALRPGFLDLVVGFIQELKRLEIWPQELSKACGPRASDKDRELCRLYGEYQRLLTEHDLYDPQGRFWLARALLREGWPRPFAGIRHVFVDGFTDFTRTEHEMLEILAGRVETLSISLPGEADSPRGDLFAKSAKTLAELRRRHPQLVIDEMPRRSISWPAMAHVERHLFGSPRHVTPASDAAGIEIVAAGGTTHEIELLARRIKCLLAQGDADAAGARVRPEDILVVFRSLDETADQVREVFGQFGVPVTIPTRPPLGRAPIVSALTAWLRLDLEEWPFRQVLAILTHNYFRPPWPEWQAGRAAAAAEQLVHRRQIPAGRAELIGSVQRWAQNVSVQTTAEGHTSLSEQAQLAAPLLVRMSVSLDNLPQSATLTEWAGAITRLAESVGLLAPSPGDALDRAAWQQLIVALASSERLATWIDSRPAVFSRREFFDHLQEILRCEPLSVDHDETGRVRVLSAEQARNLSAPYVFVAGLAEKAFPPPNREDCIYSEAETAQLIAAGLPLVPHADRSRNEMLLFYEMATRATRRLILSYPALDARAQPLSASPYLSEIEQVCQPRQIRKTTGPELSSVPTSDDVFCPRDFRVRAVSQAISGNSLLLGELFGHPSTHGAAGNILAGLRVSGARQRGESFGPFEGMVPSEAAGRALRARYGPERCWSPSQLEQYARCPHQFFLDRVLRLEPLDEPALEIDYLGRGQMLHELLSALHRNLNSRHGARRSPADQTEAEFLAQTRDLISELLARLESGRALDSGLLEIDARHVGAALADYRRQHAEYDARWEGWDVPLRPAHFEVAFGPSRHGNDAEQLGGEILDHDALSTQKPFELLCGAETILFSGRIDRIDIGGLGGRIVFNVVDYKSGRASGRTSNESVAQGYSLQLPLYALAAQELLGNERAVPFRAAYWHVAGDGYKEVIQFHAEADGELAISPDWESLDSQLRFRVRALIEGIRGGQFPMHSVDEKCTSHCAYSTVCRVNQVRSLGKTWQAPGEETR